MIELTEITKCSLFTHTSFTCIISSTSAYICKHPHQPLSPRPSSALQRGPPSQVPCPKISPPLNQQSHNPHMALGTRNMQGRLSFQILCIDITSFLLQQHPHHPLLASRRCQMLC